LLNMKNTERGIEIWKKRDKNGLSELIQKFN
jgi:hypothetical protein